MTPTRSPHASSPTRGLKILVIALVISNLGLGAFSFYLLRTLDARYSHLVEQSVPVLNDLQTLSARSVDVMRRTGATLLEAPLERHGELVQAGKRSLQLDRGLRLSLLKGEWPATAQAKEVLGRMGDSFDTIAAEVLRLVETKQIDAAKRYRDATLRPAFDEYLDTITQVADGLETESLRINGDYSVNSGAMARIVLGVGSWPVILLVGLLTVTALFVLALMLLFRGREMSDMP